MPVTRRVIAALGLGGIATYELLTSFGRNQWRQEVWAQAVARSTKTQRQLVVIGDPRAGLHTRVLPAYGCGDVCVDMNGCPTCPTSLEVDITAGIKDLQDDSSVVFVSCVLEYVSDIQAAMAEIKRIAGSQDNIFFVFVDPYTLTGILYPGAKRRVGDRHGETWHEVTTWQRVAVMSALMAVAAAAIVRG